MVAEGEMEIARLNKRIEILQQQVQMLANDKRKEFPAPEINKHSAHEWIGRYMILGAAAYKCGNLFRQIAKNMAVA